MGFKVGVVFLPDDYYYLVRRDKLIRSSSVGNFGLEKWYMDLRAEIDDAEEPRKLMVETLERLLPDFENLKVIVEAYLKNPHIMPKPFRNPVVRNALAEFCSKWTAYLRAIEDSMSLFNLDPQTERKLLALTESARKAIAMSSDAILHGYLLLVTMLFVPGVDYKSNTGLYADARKVVMEAVEKFEKWAENSYAPMVKEFKKAFGYSETESSQSKSSKKGSTLRTWLSQLRVIPRTLVESEGQ